MRALLLAAVALSACAPAPSLAQQPLPPPDYYSVSATLSTGLAFTLVLDDGAAVPVYHAPTEIVRVDGRTCAVKVGVGVTTKRAVELLTENGYWDEFAEMLRDCWSRRAGP